MSKRARIFATVIVLFLILNIVDLAADLSDGIPAWHIVHEGVLIIVSLIALIWLLRSLHNIRRQNTCLKENLASARQISQAANQQLIESRGCLAEAIARQFADWGLSRSESEVGRLLLKGLSIREIAAVRNTQEKTVRAQASSLYKKASLEGRHAFAAWFLEDID